MHPTPFKTLGQCGHRILIRTEYDHDEQAALSAGETGARVLPVTGQPGIGLFHSFILDAFSTFPLGKPISPFRLLIRRLSLEIPTGIQLVPDRAFLFHSKGVYEFEQLADARPYAEPSPKSSESHHAPSSLVSQLGN